jgi:hypothetical protein
MPPSAKTVAFLFQAAGAMTVDDDERDIFIVRVWREPRESADAPVECRGVAEHLRSGQRRFFRHIDDLDDFIRQLSCFEERKPSRR